MKKRSVAYRAAKRCFDALAALIAIVVTSPLMAVTAVVVRLGLGSPILFRQVRAGLNGAPFSVLKFRTMRDAIGPDGDPLPDAERLGSLGKFLRQTSLDEVPSFLNVLRGEMSFVGPRPLPVEYVPLYSSTQARRLEAPPGITGWAQVNGRNEVEWDRRFALDVWYVENASFWLDIKILMKTVGIVVRQEGVSAAGHATMTRFTGSDRGPG